MKGIKGAYLKRLISSMHIKSIRRGKELEGSTPPSVFIGSYNYPKVFAGPMISEEHGNTSIMDAPEEWISTHKTVEDIVKFRMNLIRGKQQLDIRDVNNKCAEKIREIALASHSVESEATFKNIPSGQYFSDEHLPYGPSAFIEKFGTENCTWNNRLETAYYDTDLKAADAVAQLYEYGLTFSHIQKAFSTGSMGIKKKRVLVPTRWSITACDNVLARYFYEQVKHNEIIDCYEVYEFSSLRNYYAIILIPGAWQYEWMEAFLRVLAKEELIFSDYETNKGKKEYSSVGGCYYTAKLAVLEALAHMKKQAGSIVLREAYTGYIPLGVFNVRENIRAALNRPKKDFPNLHEALAYVQTKLTLPVSKFVEQSTLLKEILEKRQTTLLVY